MTNCLKRLAALLLSLIMLIGLIPINAIAEDDSTVSDNGTTLTDQTEQGESDTEELDGNDNDPTSTIETPTAGDATDNVPAATADPNMENQSLAANEPNDGDEGNHTVPETTDPIEGTGDDSLTTTADSNNENEDNNTEQIEGITATIEHEIVHEAVSVNFILSPSDLTLTVYNNWSEEEEKEDFQQKPIQPELDGTYLLLPGEYWYSAEAEGFIAKEKTAFTVTIKTDEAGRPLSIEIRVILEKVDIESDLIIPIGEAMEQKPVEEELSDKKTDAEEAVDTKSAETEQLEKVTETLVQPGQLGATATADATSGTCGDNLTWSFDEPTGVLIIEGTGRMDDFYNNAPWYAPWYVYKTNIKTIILQEGVASIGMSAFSDCSKLTSIEIPNSVTSIGEDAFSGCSGLTSIEMPNSITSIGGYAFNDCSGLISIEMPNSVTSIGGYAFYGCSGLTSIEIPNSVTSIGEGAFSGCSGLTSIEIPNSVKSIGEYTFYGCSGLTSIEIPNSVTSIGGYAFNDCSRLTSIEIPNSVTSIGEGAFSGCSGLTSIEIPNSVKSIGEYTFYGCSGLTSIEIPNSVKSIGEYTFYGCSGLTSIEIPNNVMSIGGYAFDGCRGLTSIEIPNSVTSIGNYSFSYCDGLTSIEIPNSVTSIGEGAFSGCRGLTSIEIPNSVTSIGEYAFSFCWNLTSIGIPNSVTSIGEGAFSYCDGLTSIEIPNSVTSIGSYTFDQCYGLTSIEIPNSITSIGENAFSGCIGLTSIEIPNSVTSIGNYSFSYCDGLTSIEIPNSITSIGRGTFSGCSGLTSIEIPSSVTNIYYQAFNLCDKLKDVYYGGNEQMRDLITIQWGNDCLINATWHYSQSKVIPIGNSEATLRLDLVSNRICTLIIQDENGATLKCSWTSSDINVAKVNANGLVEAVKPGVTIITATGTESNVEQTCRVRVLFSDTRTESSYYFVPVYWAADNGITTGYTSGAKFGKFGVGDACTREQAVTFLWRMMGSPMPTKVANFKDVVEGAYYYNAVSWAAEKGITTGYTSGPNAGKFGVGDKCTREQLVTFLYRAVGSPTVTSYANFKDVKAGAYYYNAVSWAAGHGITTGYTSGANAGKFGVGDNCQREQVVTFIYRYAKAYSYLDAANYTTDDV